MRIKSVAIVLLAALAACSTPRVFQLAETREPLAIVKKVFLATPYPQTDLFAATSADNNSHLGDVRSRTMRYSELDISIPPGHTIGNIEWPSRASGAANPARDFAVLGTQQYENPRSFSQAIAQSANAPNDDVFLFIHGYNNTAPDATYRMAQILTDFETPLPGVVFAWPSAGRASGYLYDRDSVLFARDDLVSLLRDLTNGSRRDIVIMAHSMGTQLVMETLRQIVLSGDIALIKRIDTVVLMSPDIDIDVFQRQAQVIHPYLPDPFFVFINQEDKILRLSSFLTGRRGRVGRNLTPEDAEDLPISVIDFSALSTGTSLDHLVQVTTPESISLLRKLAEDPVLSFNNFEKWLRVEDLRTRVTDSLGDL